MTRRDLVARDEARARYAARGWRCIPLLGKIPIGYDWEMGWEGPWPVNGNLGIVTGSASGDLVVLDFDDEGLLVKHLGTEALEMAGRTLVARTARGWHVYARHAGVTNRVVEPGFDVRGNGGLVVAPPSVHESGHVYAFVDERVTVASLASLVSAELLLRLTSPSLLPASAAHVNTRNNTNTVVGWVGLEVGDLSKLEGIVRSRAAPRADGGVPTLVRYFDALRAGVRLSDESGSGDATKADFALALCWAEEGLSAGMIAWALMQLPGSKAHSRGEAYAAMTATKACALRGGA